MDFNRLLERVKDRVKDKPVATLVATNVATAVVVMGYSWLRNSGLSLRQAIMLGAINVAKVAPGGKALIAKEQQKMADKLEEELKQPTSHEEAFVTIPKASRSSEEVVEMLERYSSEERKLWRGAKISGAIYHGGDDLSALIVEAYRRFVLANPLHPDVFPYVRKMESEVASMVVNMFNGGEEGRGVITSGGTESILMALKAYRDKARAERGITAPELVAPVSAHAAFDKACHYFGIKRVKVDVDPVTFKVDMAALKKAITPNTIALVGSAVQFAQGVCDPIEEIAALGVEHNIPVHVDCCLGSFVAAFAEAAGFEMPPFDFRVKGVTSISADTHKFGFAPKGTSVIMYANNDLRRWQYFTQPDWTGGIYASPSIAGSRPGALTAACWAVMMRMGAEGYIDATRRILTAAKKIAAHVDKHDTLKLMGKPDLSVVCFASKDPSVSVYAVSDALKEQGWNLNMLQFPECAHLCVTYHNQTNADKFISDLDYAVAAVKSDPSKYNSGSVAVYGMATTLPDRSMVSDMAKAFIDACFSA